MYFLVQEFLSHSHVSYNYLVTDRRGSSIPDPLGGWCVTLCSSDHSRKHLMRISSHELAPLINTTL